MPKYLDTPPSQKWSLVDQFSIKRKSQGAPFTFFIQVLHPNTKLCLYLFSFFCNMYGQQESFVNSTDFPSSFPSNLDILIFAKEHSSVNFS